MPKVRVVGNLWYRCNNSSPRYARENHYAISCIKSKISYVFTSQDEHNASYFSICRGLSCLTPTAKLLKSFESEGVQSKEIREFPRKQIVFRFIQLIITILVHTQICKQLNYNQIHDIKEVKVCFFVRSDALVGKNPQQISSFRRFRSGSYFHFPFTVQTLCGEPGFIHDSGK